MEVMGIVGRQIRLPGAVDIPALAEALGIEYYEDDISDNVSICITRKRTVIRVDSRLPKTKRRFAGAHAIAHYIMHADILVQSQEIHRDILFGDNARHSGGGLTDHHHMQANEMAIHLLMPVARLHELLKKHGDDHEAIAAEFDLPLSMVEIRVSIARENANRLNKIREIITRKSQ